LSLTNGRGGSRPLDQSTIRERSGQEHDQVMIAKYRSRWVAIHERRERERDKFVRNEDPNQIRRSGEANKFLEEGRGG
jgi:hypothetical protein